MEEQYSLTPARRPIEKLKESPRGCKDTVAWTSARCKRLLRPLTSRFATLRKDARFSLNGSSTLPPITAEEVKQCDRQSEGLAIAERNVLIDEEEQEDREWLSERPRKRVRRTYATYSKKHNKDRDVRRKEDTTADAVPKVTLVTPLPRFNDQGDLTITPFPCSMLNPPQKQETSSQMDIKTAEKSGKASRSAFKVLAKNVRPSQWAVHDGLFSSFETLLKATTPNSQQQRTGASSLFSTCIRVIPYWIAQEEVYASLLDPHHEDDVEASIFNELETLSTVNDGRWKPFRDICRSQAVMLLCQAIHDGLIPSSLADSFVNLLIDHRAIREAKAIVRAMCSTLKHIRDPDGPAETLYSHELSYALQALKRLAQDNIGFLYEMIGLLVEKGVLSVQWCDHPDLIHIWNRVLYSITVCDYSCEQAIKLLGIAITHWGNIHVPATWQRVQDTENDDENETIQSLHQQSSRAEPLNELITALVCLVHTSNIPVHFGGKPAVSPGYATQALKTLAIETDLEWSTRENNHWLSRLALMLACPEYSNEMIISGPSTPTRDQEFQNAATCALQRSVYFVATELDTPEFSILQSLVESWTTRPPDHLHSELSRESALTVALSFAYETEDENQQRWIDQFAAGRGQSNTLEDSTWLEGISEAQPTISETQSTISMLPIDFVAPESFRWDEQIGDFIVCSPIKTSQAIVTSGMPKHAEDESSKYDFEAIMQEASIIEQDKRTQRPMVNADSDKEDLPTQHAISDSCSSRGNQLTTTTDSQLTTNAVRNPRVSTKAIKHIKQQGIPSRAVENQQTMHDPSSRPSTLQSVPRNSKDKQKPEINAAQAIANSAQNFFDISCQLQMQAGFEVSRAKSQDTAAEKPLQARRKSSAARKYKPQSPGKEAGRQILRENINAANALPRPRCQSPNPKQLHAQVRASRKSLVLGGDEGSEDELCL